MELMSYVFLSALSWDLSVLKQENEDILQSFLLIFFFSTSSVLFSISEFQT